MKGKNPSSGGFAYCKLPSDKVKADMGHMDRIGGIRNLDPLGEPNILFINLEKPVFVLALGGACILTSSELRLGLKVPMEPVA